jgi:hypothetical protein
VHQVQPPAIDHKVVGEEKSLGPGRGIDIATRGIQRCHPGEPLENRLVRLPAADIAEMQDQLAA